jgi:hypothetical protein
MAAYRDWISPATSTTSNALCPMRAIAVAISTTRTALCIEIALSCVFCLTVRFRNAPKFRIYK